MVFLNSVTFHDQEGHPVIAAFIANHGLCTFLADVYGLRDQPRKTVSRSCSLSVNDTLDQC